MLVFNFYKIDNLALNDATNFCEYRNAQLPLTWVLDLKGEWLPCTCKMKEGDMVPPF
jgi:hypothetical protein